MRKNKTPNCELCKWVRISEKYEVVMVCSAQGLNICDAVYNSKECKKLYEIEDESKGSKIIGSIQNFSKSIISGYQPLENIKSDIPPEGGSGVPEK